MDLNEFETLKPEEQARVFHQSPFKEKGELLLHSHDPEALARSLSHEELYLMTRELDAGERGEVLRYASLSQLVFVGDVECWKKDRLHPEGFLSWLETLMSADEMKLLRWLTEMDYETVVAGFQKIIAVLKPDREYAIDEILGDTPYFTLDEYYFISVREENMQTVRNVLQVLYEKHRGRYVAILEGIMAELEDELEEDAFQRREMRFAEHGFPDAETAYRIYRPLTRQEFEASPVKDLKEGNAEKFNLPQYPVVWNQERLFLDDVLLLFHDQPEISERLHEEQVWISNKVLACEGIDFSSEDRVRRGVQRTRFLINLGLESLSGRDPARAAELLKTRWLEMIFRWGVTQIAGLREQTLELARDYFSCEQARFLALMDSPYDFIFQGLLKTVPEYYDQARGEDEGFRDFKSMAEVERSGRTVVQIKKILDFLMTVPPVRKNWNKPQQGRTLFSLLGTRFASWTLNGGKPLAALSEDQFKKFLEEAFQAKGSSRVLVPEIKARFLDDCFAREDQEVLRSLWALVFDWLEEELGRLDRRGPFDFDYISKVHVEGKSGPPLPKKSPGAKKTAARKGAKP